MSAAGGGGSCVHSFMFIPNLLAGVVLVACWNTGCVQAQPDRHCYCWINVSLLIRCCQVHRGVVVLPT